MNEVQYGFRYDPITWVESDPSLQGALVRHRVFERARGDDAAVLEAEIEKLLGAQLPDGRLDDDPEHGLQFTADKLSQLAELGCPTDRAEVGKAVAAILGKAEANQADPFGIYDVRALCRLGLAPQSDYADVVRDGLQRCLERENEWGDMWEGCPWTPIEHLITLWHGRGSLDTAPVVLRWLRRFVQEVNPAGCWSYKDPWGLVRLTSEVNDPAARDLLLKEIPVLLRGQRADGGWGDRSAFVLRALKMHGLLEPLSKQPALPPDWRIVQEIPSPAASCSTLAWDGQLLWTRCTETNEAIAVGPDDGKVKQRTKLPVEKVGGIGRWDDGLAVTEKDPKRLLKVNPATGAIERAIELAEMEWINGVTQAGDRLVVGDGFLGVGMVIDPDNPDQSRHHVLGGPIPADLAPADTGVWHVDIWAPALIKTDLSRPGHLLDWGEKPFGDATGGVAANGGELWVLDGKDQRICRIEKTESGPELMADR